MSYKDQQDFDTMSRIAALLLSRLQNALTAEQQEELDNWLGTQSAENKAYYTKLTEWQTIETSLQKMYLINEESALAELKHTLLVEQETKPPSIIRGLKRYWVAAAAAILILFGVFYWQVSGPDNGSGRQISQGLKLNDLPPGGMQATLELSNGNLILLDSIEEGRVAQQQSTFIDKEDEGVIRYNHLNKSDTTPVQFNKITTPNGGQYQVVLADGSKVRLNSASSLRFPTSFPGEERVVELTGEAYFEVAPNAAKRFTVKVLGNQPMSVDALGTSFNINAYSDEVATIATLVTGKVSVNSDNDKNILEPGQQAVLKHGGNVLVKSADMEETLAWTRGLFYLQNADIHQIMRQVARWYDVDVVYEEDVQQKFIGKIPRNLNLNEVLQVLESTGWVRFGVSGKTVTVSSAQRK